MDLHENWSGIRSLFRVSFTSSLHCAVATVGEGGEPHVTPIGSLILDRPGHGFYFEEFTRQMPRNVEAGSRVCVLAVNSSRWFWLMALLKGRFAAPPGIRLYGVAKALRPARKAEIGLWQKRVGRVRFTRGHRMLWRDMNMVREIEFDRAEPVHLGAMTRDLWRERL